MKGLPVESRPRREQPDADLRVVAPAGADIVVHMLDIWGVGVETGKGLFRELLSIENRHGGAPMLTVEALSE